MSDDPPPEKQSAHSPHCGECADCSAGLCGLSARASPLPQICSTVGLHECAKRCWDHIGRTASQSIENDLAGRGDDRNVTSRQSQERSRPSANSLPRTGSCVDKVHQEGSFVITARFYFARASKPCVYHLSVRASNREALRLAYSGRDHSKCVRARVTAFPAPFS